MDFEDEILHETVVTYEGEVRASRIRERLCVAPSHEEETA